MLSILCTHLELTSGPACEIHGRAPLWIQEDMSGELSWLLERQDFVQLGSEYLQENDITEQLTYIPAMKEKALVTEKEFNKGRLQFFQFQIKRRKAAVLLKDSYPSIFYLQGR